MDKVIIPVYEADDGKEVPEHIIDVPTELEILQQSGLNVQNTSEAIRRRVLITQNGGQQTYRRVSP